MLFAKLNRPGLALLIGALLYLRLANAERTYPDAHILSDDAMAATFGDAVGNNMCKNTFDCTCTRVSGTTCSKCDNTSMDGINTNWIICCSKSGKQCDENGGGACTNLFVFNTDSGGWMQANDCCKPCRPNGTYVQVMPPVQCTNSRKNATGDDC